MPEPGHVSQSSESTAVYSSKEDDAFTSFFSNSVSSSEEYFLFPFSRSISIVAAQDDKLSGRCGSSEGIFAKFIFHQSYFLLVWFERFHLDQVPGFHRWCLA